MIASPRCPQLPLPMQERAWMGSGQEQICCCCCCCAVLEGGGAPGWAGRPSLQRETRGCSRRDAQLLPAGTDSTGSLPRCSPRGATALSPWEEGEGGTGVQGQLRKAGRAWDCALRGTAAGKPRCWRSSLACAWPEICWVAEGQRRIPWAPSSARSKWPRRRTSCCRALSVAGLMLGRNELPTEGSARSSSGGDSSCCTTGATGTRGAGLEGRKGWPGSPEQV